MTFVLRGFLRYAGAPTVREMRKTQAVASAVMRAGERYEKPQDSPDRPSNITRPIREGRAAIPADLPDNIAAQAKAQSDAQADQAAQAQSAAQAEQTAQAEQSAQASISQTPAPFPPVAATGGNLVDETA